MTMYSLPNFCRVCLKYDKNLIDLAHIENEPSETLMSKLEQCVSEVDWTVYKPLLCHPCIKRLNIAFSFKKQCVQSASVLKNYLELVKEAQKKNEAASKVSTSGDTPNQPAYMVLPNQKFVKVVVGPQQQNSFQNVFLNLIPTTGIIPVPVPPLVSTESPVSKSSTKDTNQNVFLSLNNTLQKFVPLSPGSVSASTPKLQSSTPKSSSQNPVNQLLKDTKTEELSVEIDPTIFGLEEDESESSQNDDDEANDWDEVITQSQISSKEFGRQPKMNGDKYKREKHVKSNFYGNYVPILPKHGSADFINSGQHFLSSSANFEGGDEYQCEECQKSFASVAFLKHHIKSFHLGKYPFKCEFCYTEYLIRTDYEACLRSHKLNNDSQTSLTLRDFANQSDSGSAAPPGLPQSEAIGSMVGGLGNLEEGIFNCELCKRQFNSSTGLLRHKVRKHNQKNKKKYFIKGMKNAKCDICNREFSTQSYMQLHRKLHMRDDIGYKYKVFGKSKYTDVKDPSDAKSSKKKRDPLDVTPDIIENDEDSETDEEKPLNEVPKDESVELNGNKEEITITKIEKKTATDENKVDETMDVDLEDKSEQIQKSEEAEEEMEAQDEADDDMVDEEGESHEAESHEVESHETEFHETESHETESHETEMQEEETQAAESQEGSVREEEAHEVGAQETGTQEEMPAQNEIRAQESEK